MFQNQKENKQQEPKDKNVKKEAQLENQNEIQPMGNEAAVKEFMDQVLKEAVSKSKPVRNPYEEPGADDPNNSMYLNSSHNIVNENNPFPPRFKDDSISEDEDDNIIKNLFREDEKNNEEPPKEEVQQVIAPVIQAAADQAQNGPEQQEDEKPEFYVDPEGPNHDLEDPNHPLNRDMVVEAPKRKHKKADNEINNINQDQQGAAHWNFTPQKFEHRKEASWFKRALTATSYYAGKTIGKAVSYLINLLYIPLSLSFKKWWRSRSGNRENENVQQEKRDHDTIPGWNGAKFDKSGDKANNVIADFRRVPTVWSRLTARQAADEDGNPLPPKIAMSHSRRKPRIKT